MVSTSPYQSLQHQRYAVAKSGSCTHIINIVNVYTKALLLSYPCIKVKGFFPTHKVIVLSILLNLPSLSFSSYQPVTKTNTDLHSQVNGFPNR
jgi:hypothetical protein